MCLEVVAEGVLRVLPAANGVFGQAVQLVSSWSLEFYWEVFDGMKVVSSSHMNMEKKILDPYRG